MARFTISFLIGWTFFLSIFFWSDHTAAQSISIQGVITDRQTSQPLEGANIVIREISQEEVRGTAAGPNGFYQISGLNPARYFLSISYIGYRVYEDTLALGREPLVTVSVGLEPDPESMDELLVTGTGGEARMEGGLQRIGGMDLGRVPTPSAGGDLASYLQALPGVVAAGDRGGNLFIRGGTPAENMVLVDGTLIYQPFHIIGLFSAFPEEIISNVDFYAGGFGSRYSGRTSSVLDITLRNGNLYETRASASLSPFLGEVLLEGPLKKGKSSLLVLARNSLIEETGEWITGTEQPLLFNSQLIRFSHTGSGDSRCSATAMRTYDRGRLDFEQGDLFSWSNWLLGGQCVILPEGASTLFDVHFGLSGITNSAGGNNPERSSRATRFSMDLNLSRFFGQIRFDSGLFTHMEWLAYDISEQFHAYQEGDDVLMGAGGYLEATIPLGDRILLRPGAVISLYLQTYTPSLEPRLRFSWQPFGREDEELNTVIGLYRQPLAGISDMRDAGSGFTAWMPVPAGGSQMEAIHSILGWHQDLGGGFSYSVEGYAKQLRHMPIAVWSTLATFNTDLALADGQVYGGDIHLEVQRGFAYMFIGYGYSRTRYEAAQDHFSIWFGEPIQRYHPPHDRRHQVNARISMEIGSFTANIGWQYGTGLPFTRPLGFDELFLFEDRVPDIRNRYGTPRVILDKPYNGRLPVYHRLDVSAERSFRIPFGQLHLQAGAVNLYDQMNLFYYDVFTQRQINQLPFTPYFSLKMEVE